MCLPMMLNRDMQRRIVAGELTPAEAFAMQTDGEKSNKVHYRGIRDTINRYRRVVEAARAYGPDSIRQLVSAHEELVETRADWTDCQKNARRRNLIDQWRACNGLTVTVPARNEEPEEVAATVQSWLAAGARAVIVIDDGSDVPLPELPGTVHVRHDTPRGPAYCRNLGASMAKTPVVAWSDAHVRVVSTGLDNWTFLASVSDDMLCACCESRDSGRRFYGAALVWQAEEGRFKAPAHATPCKTVAALYGSVYACRKSTWERLGGWPPTTGWGYNEQALSLACHALGVRIVCTPDFVCSHLFRKLFPYRGTGKTYPANVRIVHAALLGIGAAPPESAQYAAHIAQRRIVSAHDLAAMFGCVMPTPL